MVCRSVGRRRIPPGAFHLERMPILASFWLASKSAAVSIPGAPPKPAATSPPPSRSSPFCPSRLLSKLEVHSRLQALVFAVCYGLVEIERR